jgi:hypothetical protein
MLKIIGLTLAAVALVAFLVYAAVEDARQWEAFKTAHACRVVAKVRGHTDPVYGVDGKGNMVFSTVTTPDTTGWLCDDGVTYYR